VALGAVRLSLGRDSTAEQVTGFLAALRATVNRLRRLTAMAS